MSDLLAVVTRNRDDLEDIEEYVAREQAAAGMPTRPRRRAGGRLSAPAALPAMGRVIVVGAGVVGLSCAVRLLEAGHRVDVLARDLPRETTSAVAAAIWYPYRAWPRTGCSPGRARPTPCSRHRRRPSPTSGVRMREGTEVRGRSATRGPWWADAVPDLRETRSTVPGGYDGGWTFTTPVVEMPVYLAWLAARVLALGGTHHPAQPARAAATGDGGPDAVVDCSGLGRQVPRRRPLGAPRAGPGGAGRAGRAGALVARRAPPRGRRTSSRARATSWSAAPTSRASGAGRRPRRWPPRSCGGRCGWCRSSPARRCSATRSGCARRGPRCGWSGSVTWCTATGTAGPGSR